MQNSQSFSNSLLALSLEIEILSTERSLPRENLLPLNNEAIASTPILVSRLSQGIRTRIHATVSRGSDNYDISDSLLSEMAKQIHLSVSDFSQTY